MPSIPSSKTLDSLQFPTKAPVSLQFPACIFYDVFNSVSFNPTAESSYDRNPFVYKILEPRRLHCILLQLHVNISNVIIEQSQKWRPALYVTHIDDERGAQCHTQQCATMLWNTREFGQLQTYSGGSRVLDLVKGGGVAP